LVFGVCDIFGIFMNRLGEFQRVINSYSHIAVARRKLDGSLRGMILVKVEKGELDGKKYNLMTVSLYLLILHPETLQMIKLFFRWDYA